tara:strand:+ start:48 stop:617 length:570 start_codon:yes stop_codon:yes gene_type:complete
MAYKQSPGRSPFLKTGRDIPLNFLSPLHKEEKKDPALESLYSSSIPVGEEAVDKLISEKEGNITRKDLGGEHFGKYNVKTDSTIAANIARAHPVTTNRNFEEGRDLSMHKLNDLFTQASHETGSGQGVKGSTSKKIAAAYKKTSNIDLGTDKANAEGGTTEIFNTLPSYFNTNTKSQPGGYLSIFGTRR